eukprot:CAMPEP_0204218084 /NCGR_PEP_ID=MMETSP0361-20130328/79353_1 /ASSEMBLY_ACC=CAM_ASM_000343 /TAXON_ID=268821 /ORGANISM="Scrippsiella Hangoei, Strain SHTV-5" /LENGTH=113 /DNA_ID=CAMNT_0051183165 /DNA_START=45 /DNA_END=382 /DNA_ORIENTATION=-
MSSVSAVEVWTWCRLQERAPEDEDDGVRSGMGATPGTHQPAGRAAAPSSSTGGTSRPSALRRRRIPATTPPLPGASPPASSPPRSSPLSSPRPCRRPCDQTPPCSDGASSRRL